LKVWLTCAHGCRAGGRTAHRAYRAERRWSFLAGFERDQAQFENVRFLEPRFQPLVSRDEKLQSAADALAREQGVLALLLEHELEMERRAQQLRLDVMRGDQLPAGTPAFPTRAQHAARAGEIAEIEPQQTSGATPRPRSDHAFELVIAQFFDLIAVARFQLGCRRDPAATCRNRPSWSSRSRPASAAPGRRACRSPH
jgi:hypothetical protein